MCDEFFVTDVIFKVYVRLLDFGTCLQCTKQFKKVYRANLYLIWPNHKLEFEFVSAVFKLVI